MFDIRFDRVVSIGDSCGCAMLLRESGLRTSSGPFDWLTGASFEQRISTLCSRFQDFLLPENIVWHEAGRQDRANDVYRDEHQGYVFVHDFPKQIPLAESFSRVKEKYVRRFGRLLHGLDDGESVCFVWRSLSSETLKDEACASAVNRIAAAFPSAQCRLLVIENDPQAAVGKFVSRVCAGGACVRVTGSFYREGYDVLTGDFKLHQRVFKRLGKSPTLAWKIRKESWLRAAVRFMSLWHIDHEVRKLSRKRLTERFCRKDCRSSIGW